MVDKPNVNTDTANPVKQGVAGPGPAPAAQRGPAPNAPARETATQGQVTSTQPRDREGRATVTATEAQARARLENPAPVLTTPDTRTGNVHDQQRIAGMTKQERMNMSEADKPNSSILGFALGAQVVLEAAAALSETFLRYNTLKAQAVAQGRTEFTPAELEQIRGARRDAVARALAAGNDPTQPPVT